MRLAIRRARDGKSPSCLSASGSGRDETAREVERRLGCRIHLLDSDGESGKVPDRYHISVGGDECSASGRLHWYLCRYRPSKVLIAFCHLHGNIGSSACGSRFVRLSACDKGYRCRCCERRPYSEAATTLPPVEQFCPCFFLLFRGLITLRIKHINMSFTKNRDIRNRRCQLIPSSRPSPRLPTSRNGAFFASVDTAEREANSGDRCIGAWGNRVYDFVPCVGRRYSPRSVRLSRTFCPIYGHFRPVSGHSPTMSAIA